jgi:integrase
MRRRDPFEDAGLATRWSAATRRKTACGYGRFLFWLLERGELDVTADPAARITHERLTSYLEDLRSANRGHTIHNRIQELGDAMRVLVPDHDWSFIRRAAARLRADAVPARDKRGRLPPIAEIVAQGYRMMARAERPGARSELARAALYRDGLLLVFLAYHPLRLRNLSSLRIGRHLFDHGDRIVLCIAAPETKARSPIEQELGSRLSCAVRRYIDRYRPVLLRARGRWHAPTGDALWVSRDGSPCSAQTFCNIIKKYAAGPDGRPLSPHLFRSMAATSVATEALGAVDLIPAILTHRSHRTGEQYYNLADSLDASRAFNAALDAVRQNLSAAVQGSGTQKDEER